jgi:hypothetical protein
MLFETATLHPIVVDHGGEFQAIKTSYNMT